jgi:hypothetical protein
VGFADPEARVGFGYAMNRMGPHILLDPRADRLIDAVYDALFSRPRGFMARVKGAAMVIRSASCAATRTRRAGAAACAAPLPRAILVAAGIRRRI